MALNSLSFITIGMAVFLVEGQTDIPTPPCVRPDTPVIYGPGAIIYPEKASWICSATGAICHDLLGGFRDGEGVTLFNIRQDSNPTPINGHTEWNTMNLTLLPRILPKTPALYTLVCWVTHKDFKNYEYKITAEKSISVFDKNPCQNRGKFVNILKKSTANFKCNCESGFIGKTCDKTYCTTNPCQNGGKCIILKNSTANFKCDCKSGFNGKTCDNKEQDPFDPDSDLRLKITLAIGIPFTLIIVGWVCYCIWEWCRQGPPEGMFPSSTTSDEESSTRSDVDKLNDTVIISAPLANSKRKSKTSSKGSSKGSSKVPRKV